MDWVSAKLFRLRPPADERKAVCALAPHPPHSKALSGAIYRPPLRTYVCTLVTAQPKTRVVVGLSGGVDSSATAALLLEQGYDVVGITLKLWPQDCVSRAEDKCCGPQAVTDARAVCHRLGIPYYLIDERKLLRNLEIIERVEIENGLPHPTLGGVWARRSPEQMRSYLFVDLSESTADAMIAYARAGGFGYIVIYDGMWNGSHGSYPVNRTCFPKGEAGLKAVSDKIHAAGLKFGMHNLDMVVSKDDPLVRPVPASGFLMYPDRRRIPLSRDRLLRLRRQEASWPLR